MVAVTVNWTLSKGPAHILALLAIGALSIYLLLYPLFRNYPDDRGDGGALVLLPEPKTPRWWRTAAFALIFAGINVLYHSVVGPLNFNTLYANAVSRLSGTVVVAPSEIAGYFANFNMGLRFLMAATMLSMAIVCRGNLLRKLIVVSQVVWYLLAMMLIDSILTVVNVLFGFPVAPATFIGNFAALGLGFFGMTRMLFTNFALPRPSAVPFKPRPRLGDAFSLLAASGASIALCASLVLYLYHVANPNYRDLLVILAPIPFGALAVVLRSLILIAFNWVIGNPEPPVGTWRPPIEIIIPAYNEEEVIVETLEAIDKAAGRYGGPVNVIMSNDGSTDATEELARSTMAAFAHATGRVINVRHGGKSATLNAALAETTADLIIRIDADTLITEWALYYVPRWFRDPQVGLVEAMMWPRWCRSPFPHMRLFEEQKQFGLLHRTMGSVDGINVVPGVFTAFRRQPAVELGGFTVGMNGEDGDFTLRMSRLGWATRQDPRVVVREGVPPTYLEIRGQRVRWDRATIHNQARHGAYRAGIATPKVWYNQTHQFYSRMFAPVRLMLPVYLAVTAIFEGTWRTPILLAVGAYVVSQIGFMALECLLSVAYRHERQMPWVLLWPLWQVCLIIFSTEALLSLPGRPASLRTGAAPAEVAKAVVH